MLRIHGFVTGVRIDISLKRSRRWYQSVRREIEAEFATVFRSEDDRGPGRKAFAERLRNTRLRHGFVLFACLDGKKAVVDRYIMKSMKPSGNELQSVP